MDNIFENNGQYFQLPGQLECRWSSGPDSPRSHFFQTFFKCKIVDFTKASSRVNTQYTIPIPMFHFSLLVLIKCTENTQFWMNTNMSTSSNILLVNCTIFFEIYFGVFFALAMYVWIRAKRLVCWLAAQFCPIAASATPHPCTFTATLPSLQQWIHSLHRRWITKSLQKLFSCTSNS